jgi:FkbM family methyltransferase
VSSPTTVNRSVKHHPVFGRFKCWEGLVPENRIVDFLGVMTSTRYGHPYFSAASQAGQRVCTDYPALDEEYFEWIDLLEAVVTAKDHFTMFELGAGWGRWTACAAAALRQFSGLSHTFLAVEAEPSHFQWLTEHLAENGLQYENLRLVQAAINDKDGKIGFRTGKDIREGNVDWYGQSIGGSTSVDSVSLKTLLTPFETVDLIDLDIQGAELDVLQAAAGELNGKVKRIHIGTHSRRIEEGLCSLFGRLGWFCLCAFEGDCTTQTEWGTVSFQDGVQSWVNPAFWCPSQDDAVVLARKLQISRDQCVRLQMELASARAQLQQVGMVPGSLSWKLLATSRRVRELIAPSGTRRRKLCNFLLQTVGGEKQRHT